MQSIKILVASFFLTGCNALQFPAFPEGVKHQNILVVKDGQAFCFEAEIISTYPYKISEDPVYVSLDNCAGVGGFSPDNMKLITNWMDDVKNWSEKHTCQVK